MSSFWGYVAEGSALTILWLWWMVHTFVGVIKAESEGKEFIPKLSHGFRNSRIPLETIFKLTASTLAFIISFFQDGVAWTDDDGNYRKMATVITMTIYGIFMVHSLIEMLLWLGFPLIQDAHYVTGALGFLWYALATYYRAKDFLPQAPVAVMVKTFPMYPLFGIAVALLIEAERKRGYWTQMMRVLCLGVVATWDWNAAFILHVRGSKFPGVEPSNWDFHDHDNTSFIGAAFGDHICLHLIFLCLAYALTYLYMRVRHGLVLSHGDSHQH